MLQLLQVILSSVPIYKYPVHYINIVNLIFWWALTTTTSQAESSSCSAVNSSSRCYCNKLDIDCSKLRQMPQFANDGVIYDSLDVSYTRDFKLPNNVLGSIRVRKLTMDHTPMGQDIHPQSLFNQAPYLEEMSFANSRIRSIPNLFFSRCSRLRILHLWGNRLDILNRDTFFGLSATEELRLWANHIILMEPPTFSVMPRLKILDLDYNRLTILTEKTFQHLQSLQSLHLSSNSIASLYENTFRHLQSLRVLKLSKNHLRVIHPNAFAGLRALASLDLENNDIDTLLSNTFRDLSSLRFLKLNNNRLKFLWADTFKGLKFLRHLDMSHNELENMRPGLLRHLTQMHHLYLDDVLMVTLDRCIFADAMQLKTVSLTGNPLQCSCAFTWIMLISLHGSSVSGSCRRNIPDQIINIATPTLYGSQCSFQMESCASNPELMS